MPDAPDLLRDQAACHLVRDFVQNFANPLRLRLLCELSAGERGVSELVEVTGARQSAVSQQLLLLRLAGLVSRDRLGSRMVYKVADPLVVETIAFLLGVASELVRRSPAEEAAGGGDLGERQAEDGSRPGRRARAARRAPRRGGGQGR